MAEEVQSPETEELPRYVGFQARMFGFLVDLLLVAALLGPLLSYLSQRVLFDGVNRRALVASLGPDATVRDLLQLFIEHDLLWRIGVEQLLPIFALLAFSAYAWSQWGRTPGKWILGILVVDVRSRELPTLKQSIIRALGYCLSAAPLMLGFFWMSFNPRRRAWHDMLAGTVVIFDPARPRLTDFIRKRWQAWRAGKSDSVGE